MKDRIVMDLGRIMDEIFEAAEKFGDAFQNGFSFGHGPHEKRFHWDEKVDFYPAYSYPPANVYLSTDRSLNFEFALAGFDENSIDLEFQGDYMVLSVKVSDDMIHPDGIRYFKRRLKFKDIEGQKYYVPADKFDRENVKAVFKRGLLIVVIPPKEEYETKEGVKIEIVKGDE